MMHLPQPTSFGSRGRPGVSLESILDPPTLRPDQECMQLAPMVNMSDIATHGPPCGFQMSRTPSISSTSSGESFSAYENTPSTSTSPTFSTLSLEPSHNVPRSMNKHGMRNSRFLHHASSSKAPPPPKSASKAIRRKRTDRHIFMPRNGPVAPVKASVEGNRRYLQGIAYTKLQHKMLAVNPSLPQTAAPRPLRDEGGWRKLRSWNQSGDIRTHEGLEPFCYGKEDIMLSSLLALEQSDAIIADVLRVVQGYPAQIEQSGISSAETGDFLRRKINDLTARVHDSCGRRAGRDWRGPVDLSEQRCKL